MRKSIFRTHWRLRGCTGWLAGWWLCAYLPIKKCVEERPTLLIAAHDTRIDYTVHFMAILNEAKIGMIEWWEHTHTGELWNEQKQNQEGPAEKLTEISRVFEDMRINFEMFVVFLRLGMTAVFSKKKEREKERGGYMDNRSADARQWHQRSDGIASAVYSTFIFFFCVIIRGVCLCACDFSDTHIFFLVECRRCWGSSLFVPFFIQLSCPTFVILVVASSSRLANDWHRAGKRGGMKRMNNAEHISVDSMHRFIAAAFHIWHLQKLSMIFNFMIYQRGNYCVMTLEWKHDNNKKCSRELLSVLFVCFFLFGCVGFISTLFFFCVLP